MEKYSITEEMMDNCAITFSMYDVDLKTYRIANVNANLNVRDKFDRFIHEPKYTISYCFSLKDTKTYGNYIGEFKIDFLGDGCGKITLPVDEMIKIFIQKSITKTTVSENFQEPSNTSTSDEFDYLFDFNL